MPRHKNQDSEWIGSLVKELDLGGKKQPQIDVSTFRAQLEESKLFDRIQKTVIAVNEEAGYPALYLLDFLPPHRSILRLSFTKKKTEYIMEVVLRANGPAVVFHSAARGQGPLERYLLGFSRSLGSTIAVDHTFKPSEITDDLLRAWFSCLLSGFSKKFNPELYLQAPESSHFELNGFLDKASA